MQTYPTLYSRDTIGNIRVWWMERDGFHYRTASGIKDGEIVHSEWRRAYVTNQGKANERSAEIQADAEIKSSYDKKLRMKYHEAEADVDKDKYFKPMLAKEFGKETSKKGVSFPVHSQPKLDGIRCLVTAEGAWSRTGKPILAIPHILEALAPLFAKDPDLVLDGELYNHDLKDDFNTITSVVRKLEPNPEQLADSARLIQYHVYDCPSVDGSFEIRINTLVALLMNMPECVVLVDTQFVLDQETLDFLYAEYMKNGYEGQMVRLGGTYEQKRSKFLLKRKEFKDAEFEIVEVKSGQGNWEGYAKTLTVRLPDGRTCDSGMRGNQQYLKEVLENADSYVGKQATIRYQDLTPDGKLRFPVAVALHLEERW